MAGGINFHMLERLMALAIEEDIGPGDITSESVFNDGERSKAKLISKDKGIFCGADAASFCYKKINPEISLVPIVSDGDTVGIGDTLMKIEGPTKSILAGERIVLNIMQRMSGIATRTNYFISLIKDTKIKILDTRKTLPGFRALDKYAVKTGGGMNHRMGLYDMIMIKDNHIKAAGGIGKAVELARKKHGDKYKIEVEASSADEAKDAVQTGADVIMLDNMNRDMIIESIKIINGRSKIEISGNMDEEKIIMLSGLEIDYISIGALTHSVKAFDISMKFE